MSRNITELKKLNNDRYDYSRISGELPLPNLVEIGSFVLKSQMACMFSAVRLVKSFHSMFILTYVFNAKKNKIKIKNV